MKRGTVKHWEVENFWKKRLIPQNPDLRFKEIIKINPTQKQQEQGQQLTKPIKQKNPTNQNKNSAMKMNDHRSSSLHSRRNIQT